APHRTVLAPPADPGTPDHANRRGDPERHRTPGRRRGHRGPASLHDDARSREAAFVGGYIIHARQLPPRRGNQNRIPIPDPSAHEWRVGTDAFVRPGRARLGSLPSVGDSRSVTALLTTCRLPSRKIAAVGIS